VLGNNEYHRSSDKWPKKEGKVIEYRVPRRIDVHVGMRIAECRVSARLSQERLAMLVGLTPEQVRNCEAGKIWVGALLLFDIAVELGVSLCALYGEKALEEEDIEGQLPTAAPENYTFVANNVGYFDGR
jgi:transcriptional regulator with XRE-family HTH domain